MDNGRGHCAHWQSCKVPNQTHRGMKKNRKMYAIKQIKIYAEYRDMLPRPRLDLSGTPGLRPIGLSPGSWQTSLGLGSMSRYSAQILICIGNSKKLPVLPKSCQSRTLGLDLILNTVHVDLPLWNPNWFLDNIWLFVRRKHDKSGIHYQLRKPNTNRTNGSFPSSRDAGRISTIYRVKITGDPLHSRALAHSRAPLFTQPCPPCSHSRAPGEQWARLCVFTLQGCVQAARLCRGSPVKIVIEKANTFYIS